MDWTVPPAAEPGDGVAIVAPASGLAAEYEAVYDYGIERIEAFGLDPVPYPTATADDDYLYDHPEKRARDVESAFRDPEIAAVIATIGGNDQIRVLDRLDTDVLAANPTRFFGFSDNTNIALALWNEGIVSYHGGMVMTQWAQPGAMFDHTERYLRRALFEDELGDVEPAPAFSDEPADFDGPTLDEPRGREDNPGHGWAGADETVAGRVWGGCLEILDVGFVTDRYLPPDEALDGRVLAVETSEELPGPELVRRVLMAMGERGVLERFAGVLVGRPIARAHDKPRDREWRKSYRADLRDAIETVVSRYNPDAPIVTGLDFGHTHPNVPIPIGGRVEIDPGEKRVSFSEP
ncbi:LD-carboxypeptidase [Halobacteriales archaeon SW_7_68_16]|nr:MAG: LD-carboxypeptidase [Halobacteriales archaeon SW_7_68_16]